MVLLDQTRLPGERVERSCRTVAELIDAIQVLAIRGAPALGVAGAMGIALAARTAPDHPVGMRQYLAEQGALLAAARPTAVNLAWGVGEALAELDREVGNPHEARGRIAARARRIQDEEVARCRAMGAHGATLFADGAHLMTQCNTGGLATGGDGTALGVVLALAERGGDPHVWVPETRPLLQGSRLTTYELAEAGVRHTLVTDNATGAILREGAVAGIVVGADRIASNGDTANKIGTYAWPSSPTTTASRSTSSRRRRRSIPRRRRAMRSRSSSAPRRRWPASAASSRRRSAPPPATTRSTSRRPR